MNTNTDLPPSDSTEANNAAGAGCMARIVRPSDSSELLIEAFCQDGDPPFIFAVTGKISISVMEEIEQDMIDNPEMFDRGDGEYLFAATRQEGQQSFPETGQWDFPPHWELELIHFLPNAIAQTPPDDGTQNL